MSEQTRKRIIYAVFIAAVIWGVFNFMPGSKKDKQAKQMTATETVVPHVNPQASIANQTFVNVEEKAKEQWGRDPFRAVTTKNTVKQTTFQSKHWDLSGILYNDKFPVAIINNSPAKEGDTVNNAKIIKIDKKEVVIEYNGTQIVLTVAKG